MELLKKSSHKEGAVAEQLHETQPTKNEGCMLLKAEAEAEAEALRPAQRLGAIRKDDHRFHRHGPSEKKW
jgi:hypothetical protein